MEREKKFYRYNGRIYPIGISWDIFNYEDLVLNIEQVRNWCSEGCPNYNNNGGCPPFSPTAEELLKGREFILLMGKVKLSDFPHGESEDKVKFADELLSSFMIKLGYKVKEEADIQFLNPSCCRGCDLCTIKTGCKKPDKMAYCITGTGIMLGDVIENLFNEKLQWFSKDSKPEYIIRIMAFITDEKIRNFKNSIHSFIENL